MHMIFINRRIYRGGFTEFTREEISAMGSLPLWEDSNFCLRVRIVPSQGYGLTLNPGSQQQTQMALLLKSISLLILIIILLRISLFTSGCPTRTSLTQQQQTGSSR